MRGENIVYRYTGREGEREKRRETETETETEGVVWEWYCTVGK